jgi:hypothetical protein
MAAVAEIDPGQVQGFTLFLYLRDGKVHITTNACCTRHALSDLAAFAAVRVHDLVLCSGEE